MKRSSYFLTEQQKGKLDQNSKKIGITSSELLRRIIDKYLEEVEVKDGLSKAHKPKNRRD